MRNDLFKTLPTLLMPVTFAISLLSGCEQSSSSEQPSTSPTVSVQTVRAHQGEVSRSLTLPTFKLLPWQEATLYAKVPGYLQTLKVDIGDTVTQGQLLAEIEVPEMLAERPKYQAQVEAAELDYRRIGDARKQSPDLVMPQTVDNAKAKYNVAKADLERLETMLGYANITAPFSGVITRRWVDPGAFIPAATSSSAARDAAVLTLADSSTVRVQVAVPESEAPFIKNGLPAQVTADELPGRVFDGTVTRYAHALDDATKTVLTEVDIPNPDGVLLPGMFASVKLVLERKSDALLVPAEALVIGKNQMSVFTVANGKARKVAVKTGFNDGISAEIVAGLQAGEPVVVAGQQMLSDGQPVNAVEQK